MNNLARFLLTTVFFGLVFVLNVVAQEAEGELDELEAAKELKSAALPTPDPSVSAEAKLTPSPAVGGQSAARSRAEMLQWELELAASGYDLNPSDANRSRYLAALEKVVASLCMHALLSSLEYSSAPQEQDCRDNLDKLVALDDLNPIGVCARDGIFSATCKERSAAQNILVFKKTSSTFGFAEVPASRAELELAFRLDSEVNSPHSAKILSEIGALDQSLKSAKEPSAQVSLKLKIRKTLAKLLRQSCKATRVRLEPAKSIEGRLPTPAALSAVRQKNRELQNERILKDIDQLLNKPNSATPANEVALVPEKLIRVRYISEACKVAIDNSKLRDINYAGADCAYHGFFTPECTAARAKEAKSALNEMQNLSGSATPASGASTGKSFEEF